MSWPVRLSIGFVALIFVVSAFAPWIAPYAPDAQSVQDAYMSAGWPHVFGTDSLGRDLFSRLIYGCRVSMAVALMTAFSSVVIGIIYGTISGWFGGAVDRWMMRAIDVLYTLPSLIIMILVMLVFGRGLGGIFVALTATGWLGTARLVRAQVLSWKSRPFVEAGRSIGVPGFRLAVRHVLPNCLGPVVVELSYQIPTNVLAEAFLSFLGVGLRPPTPSWGILADEGWRALQVYPHLTIYPGAAIFLTMLSFNLIGDHLRDRLDPMLRSR